MSRPLAVIVMAAGLGKRTNISIAKALLPLCGRSVLHTVLDATAALGADSTVVVLHHQKQAVEKTLAGREGLTVVDQGTPRGTGHAVQVACGALGDFAGDVLVVNGDCPLILPDTLRRLREARGEGAAAILTAFQDDPRVGRVLRDGHGNILGIREHQDCSAEEREIREINAGFYCFDAGLLREALARLSADNAQGEYYLTDTVGLLLDAGHRVVGVAAEDGREVQGINTLAELGRVRAIMQERILLGHMSAGVLIEDPATTFIDHDVEIGEGARVLPCTVVRAGVRIGPGCEVGPFSHLRAGTVLEEGAEIGNFVEVKNSVVGTGTKAKHLTYLGDTTIGAGANVGAGTITANYDGRRKHRTVVGARAFVGSGTVLVAPCRVGDGAMTGAGAIVTRRSEIPEGDVWVGVPAKPLAQRKAGTQEGGRS